MDKVLDNLFGKKDEKNEDVEKVEQIEPVVEPVSERGDYPKPIHVELDNLETDNQEQEKITIESEEIIEPEEPVLISEEVVEDVKCDKVDNSVEHHSECLVKELRELLSRSTGLDFELVELRKNIYDLLDKHEARCKIKD